MQAVKSCVIYREIDRLEGLSIFSGHILNFKLIEIQDLEGVQKKMSSLEEPTYKKIQL